VGVELHRCRCCSTWDPLMGHYTLFFVTVGLRIMTLLLTILVTTRSTVYTPYIRTRRVTTLLARTHILLLLACALLHFWGLRTTFTVLLLTGYSAGMLAVDWLKRYPSNDGRFMLVIEIRFMECASKGRKSVPVDSFQCGISFSHS